MNSDLINRQDAIDALSVLDISDGMGISCIASGVQYSAIRAIEGLPSAGSERMHDIMDYTRYQVEWLESHNDIELEPELEKWMARMLYDTAECYIKEHPETERKTGEWVGIREYCDYLRSLDGKMYVPSGIGITVKYCNLCWESAERGTNYCPNCGAKMEAQDDN